MLTGKTILIVEDEVLVAMDLADTVAAAGGAVAGPFETVAAAQALIEAVTIDGAVCDARLADRDVTPLALALVEQGVPLVIHSATGPPAALAAVHPDLTVVRKPAVAELVIAALSRLLDQARR